jgi:hypothetical protein
MKATNDLIKKKVHQNRSLPSKLVEFYLKKPKFFTVSQVDLKVRSIYSAFNSLFLLFSLASANYHKTNLFAESRSNATRQIFNQEIFMNFFFVEIFVISLDDFNVGLFFWLELGWPGIDCVLVDGLQEVKID